MLCFQNWLVLTSFNKLFSLLPTGMYYAVFFQVYHFNYLTFYCFSIAIIKYFTQNCNVYFSCVFSYRVLGNNCIFATFSTRSLHYQKLGVVIDVVYTNRTLCLEFLRKKIHKWMVKFYWTNFLVTKWTKRSTTISYQ